VKPEYRTLGRKIGEKKEYFKNILSEEE